MEELSFDELAMMGRLIQMQGQVVTIVAANASEEESAEAEERMRQFTMCLLSDELLDAEAKEGPGRGNAVGGQREQTVKVPSKGMLEERQRTNDMLSATGLTSQEFEDLFVVLSTEDVARPDLPRLQHPRNLDGPNHLTDAANAHRCDTDGCHTAPSHPPRSLPREGTLLKLKIQSRASLPSPPPSPSSPSPSPSSAALRLAASHARCVCALAAAARALRALLHLRPPHPHLPSPPLLFIRFSSPLLTVLTPAPLACLLRHPHLRHMSLFHRYRDLRARGRLGANKMSVKERLFNFLYVSRNHYTYEEAERQLGWNKDSCRNNFFWMRYILSRDPSLESELRWFTNEEVDEIGALMLDFDPDLADILFIADGSKDPFHHIRYDKRKEQFHCNQKVRTMVYRSSSSSVIEYTRCVRCIRVYTGVYGEQRPAMREKDAEQQGRRGV